MTEKTDQSATGKKTRGGRGRLRFAAMLTVFPLLAAPGLGQPAFAAGTPDAKVLQEYKAGSYIVVLKEDPVATYEGGVPGIAATKAEKGRKLDTESGAARSYAKHLEQKQDAVAAAASVTAGIRFTTTLNGFVTDLTAEQAAKLAKNSDVLALSPNELLQPDYASVDNLGLRGPGGTWETRYGGVDNAGKGVVVGVIDTGYYPESPYLAGESVEPLAAGQQPEVGVPYRTADGDIAMLKADGSTFQGDCEPGQDFAGTECNSKVLGARYYSEDFEAVTPPELFGPYEKISPIDGDSHGTHTASTAAGNNGVQQTVGGRDMGTGSGVAPAAKVSVYKVCWEAVAPAASGCTTASSVAAIDDAVADGVDVLNFSISGTEDSTTDPVALAFLSASAAGIFVATSAGNSGPSESTVNHASPWLSAVAASSFSNELTGTVELSDGTKYRGASSMAGPGVPQTPIVLAEESAAEDVPAEDADLCLPDSLDPAAVTGKIVVCTQGVNPRVEKSAVVKDAGGVGMVLLGRAAGSELADVHAVPTVHIFNTTFKARVAAAEPGLTAALRPTDTTGLKPIAVPQVAAFSSRGPSLAENGDLLKPDITAPGVSVVAGVLPAAHNGETSGLLSGTSMSSPHVAGFAALMLGKYPDWSPAAVKSAMMTTAGDVRNADGSVNEDVFAVGAGYADPAAMTNPGLVYDAGWDHWAGYLQGLGFDLGLRKKQEVKATDVNVPSIAVGRLTGDITVTRTVTAVTPGRYQADLDLPGINARVTPSVLHFTRPGQTRTFKIRFENQSAALNEFATGSLTWQGRGLSVTSPVAVRPVTATVPESVSFTSETGTGQGEIPVVSGTNNPMPLTVEGLAKANSKNIEKVPGGPPAPVEDASNSYSEATVPADATTATFAVNAEDAGDDWDLFVITPSGSTVSSATGSASEKVVLSDPEPGRYFVIANLFSTTDQQAGKARVDVTVLSGDEGNLSVTPNPLRLANGSSGAITAAWSGLEEGSYTGTVRVGTDGPVVTVYVSVGAAGASVPVPEELTREFEGGELNGQSELGG